MCNFVRISGEQKPNFYSHYGGTDETMARR
jgi:hypothetical protein